MLKRRENPKSAPTQIQYQYSSVKKPLDWRRTFQTVVAFTLGSVFGYTIKMNKLVTTSESQ